MEALDRGSNFKASNFWLASCCLLVWGTSDATDKENILSGTLDGKFPLSCLNSTWQLLAPSANTFASLLYCLNAKCLCSWPFHYFQIAPIVSTLVYMQFDSLNPLEYLFCYSALDISRLILIEGLSTCNVSRFAFHVLRCILAERILYPFTN